MSTQREMPTRSLREQLDARSGEDAHLVLRRATVLDPVAGIDAIHDVIVRGGKIAALASPGAADTEGAEVVEAEGLHAFPAFFDPHVHLRTPGHEHKEDVETGTRAAAAGGYCGILAMANTEPPVSTAADISALREQARAAAWADALRAGEQLAGLAGTGLGSVRTIDETGGYGGPPRPMAARVMGAAEVGLEPGGVGVQVALTVVWELR